MKNIKARIIFLAICTAFFILPNVSLALEPGRALIKEGEVLIKYKNPPLGEDQYQVIQLQDNEDSLFSSIDLAKQDNIEFAEPVYLRQMSKTPNDPYYDYYQWHLNQSTNVDINAPEAWERTTGKAGVVVAVIDSGVDLDHPDLADNIWTNSGEIPSNGIDDDGNGYVDDYYGWDFVNNNNDPNPEPDGLDNDGDGYTDYGVTHGTHVAGIIGAKGDNSVGVAGVCWNCKIMPLQVLSDEGWGDSAAISEAINYAVANGADVINMSLGSYGYSYAEAQACEDAQNNGVSVIAAVGNDTVDLGWYPNYPSCYDGVVGVTASDEYDYPAYFSNYGSCADIAAPGNYIYSSLYYNYSYGYYYYYGYMSGTSMASPVVAGTAALLKSYNSDATVTKISNTLIKSVDSVSTISSDYGAGRLNANKSLKNIKDNTAPTAPSKITAYTKPNKKKKITKGQRTKEKSPYFSWTKGTDNKGVAGYYVYWGTKSKANPKTKGTFQTKRTLKKYKVKGNGKKYYLRIKTKDTSNNVSSKTTSFKYVVDNKAKAPYSMAVSSTSDGVKVTWKAKETHVKTFNIYRRKVKANGQTTSWKKVNSSKVTDKKFTDSSAEDWTKYQYRVQVKDSLGNTAYSKASSTIKYRP